MQLFSGFTSVPSDTIVCGIVTEALYVPVHVETVGSVIQSFTVVTSLVSVVHTEPSHFEDNTVGKVDAPLYVDVQSAAVGSVMQAFSTVRSTFEIADPPRDFGIVPAAPYVAKQEVDVGLFIQSLIGVRSVLTEETDFGNVPAPLYVEVQDVAVGSVMQLFNVDTSDDVEAQVVLSHFAERTFGSVDGALYVLVQLAAVGSVMHVLRVVTSPNNVVHAEPSHFDAKTVGKDEELL